MPRSLLEFSDVTFGFGKKGTLFQKLCLSLCNESGRGWIVAIMGPSGVGKSTLCDLAVGTKRPREGRVSVSPPGAHVAVIPQRGVIFEELDVRANVGCLRHSKTLGGTFEESRVAEAIQALGLSGVVREGTPAGVLSGGEAQRVMLARIHTVDCQLLILDEPCSFLDNRVKDSFLDALRESVNEMGILALFVTHVWQEAERIADEVLFLSANRARQVNICKVAIDEARLYPPTIDALFGIHWPGCVLLDREELTQLQGRMDCLVPAAARSGGLFRDELCDPVGQLVEEECLSWILASRGSVPRRRRMGPMTDARGGGSLHLVFYDEDGMAVEGEKRTECVAARLEDPTT